LNLLGYHEVENILITFSDAVANRVPCKLSAIQLRGASCAAISRGGLSVSAKSTTWTCPDFRPGNANNELLLFGHKTQRPMPEKQQTQLVLIKLSHYMQVKELND
jgi:hypothetical protein